MLRFGFKWFRNAYEWIFVGVARQTTYFSGEFGLTICLLLIDAVYISNKCELSLDGFADLNFYYELISIDSKSRTFGFF